MPTPITVRPPFRRRGQAPGFLYSAPLLADITGAGGVLVGGSALVQVGGPPVPSDIVVEVDWDNDGDFDEPEEDITDLVLVAETFTGRDWPSLLTGRAGPGRFRASLNNTDDRFAYFNANSPLNQGAFSLDIGRRLRVRTSSASSPDPALLAIDRFTGELLPNGRLDQTENGLTWTQPTLFSWTIVDEEASAPGNDNVDIDLIDVGTADYYLQAKLANVGGDASASASINGNVLGLIYRWQDVDNYSRAVLDVDAGQLQLIDVVAGSPTTIATDAVEVYDGMTIGVLVEGSTVTLFQEGVALLSDTALQTDQTQVGIYGVHGDNNEFPTLDDFHVWDGLPAEVEGVLWTGDTSALTTSVAPGPVKVATLEGQGWLGRPAAQRVSPPTTTQGRTTGVLVGATLADVRLLHPPGSIDAGDVTTGPFGLRDLDAIEALRRVEETEFGFLHEAQEGYIGFDARSARDGSTSQVVFSDAAVAQYDYYALTPRDWRREIFNQVNAGVADQVPSGITVSTNTRNTFDSGPLQITMPSTVNAGDLLLVAITATGAGSNNFDGIEWETPDGWQQLYSLAFADSSVGGRRVYARVADGTEGSTTLDFATQTADSPAGSAVAHTYRITDWYGDISGVAAVGPIAGFNDPVVPVPWDLAPTLFIAIRHGRDLSASGSTPDVATAALDYTNLISTVAVSGDDKASGIATCRRSGVTTLEVVDWLRTGVSDDVFTGLGNTVGVIAIRGYAGDPPGSGVTVTVDDTASQDARNSIRTHRLASRLFASEVDAEAYGEQVVATHADDRPILAMSFYATKNAGHRAQAIRRRVSHRITVEADNLAGLGIDRDFYIESIGHRWSQGTHLWQTTWELSPVPAE